MLIKETQIGRCIMKNHHIDRPDLKEPIVLTRADLSGENQCVISYVDCMEQENGSLICKTIKNNCLDQALHHEIKLDSKAK